MGKPRKDPLAEGSLKAIYTILVHPFVKMKPEKIHLNDWLDLLWGTEDRTITRYVSKEDFKMPGTSMICAKIGLEKIGHRQIRAGQEVWIRVDPALNQIDVEVMTGVGKKAYHYQLKQNDYEIVLKKLTVKPFRVRKRVNHSWSK